MKHILFFVSLVIELLFGLILVAIYCNFIVVYTSEGRVYSSSDKIEKRKVGLVLGTAPALANGYPNAYFTTRVDATAELFHKGKIDLILVSGDNGSKEYDEPTAFKEALIKKGVPGRVIFLDYAGFRTLDSIIRAKEVFGLKKLTIVSQKFHNQRAIFLAKCYGMDAIGFNADEVTAYYGFGSKYREFFARGKAIYDVCFKVEPKFYGPKIQLN